MKTSKKSTVIVLGAGASVAAGAPVMRNFFDIADNIFSRGLATWANSSFDAVFSAREQLQAANAKSYVDIDNIENVFSTFEMASMLGRLNGISDPSKLPAALRHLIFRTLELSIKFELTHESETIGSPYPYDAFAQLIGALNNSTNIGPITIINFNYDLALDYALKAAGISFSYGMEGTQRNPGAVLLLKPHGSLNWIRSEAGSIHVDEVQPLKSAFYWRRLGVPNRKRRSISIDTMELLHNEIEWGEALRPPPYIVPPTWNKAEYQKQLASVWRNASRAVGDASNIFVMGYSLPPSDQFFKSFLAISLSTYTMIDNFRVYDPGDVAGHWQTVCGPSILGRQKFQHEKITFSEGIRHLASEFLKNSNHIEILLDRPYE